MRILKSTTEQRRVDEAPTTGATSNPNTRALEKGTQALSSTVTRGPGVER
jgi:hypothetical protein